MDKKVIMFNVIFIHGLGKNSNQWNITEHGKNINIEKIVASKSSTLMYDIKDFTEDPQLIINDIIEKIKSIKGGWIIVCHSLGAIYSLGLLVHDISIIGFVLIDPTPFDTKYIEIIQERGWIKVVNYFNNTTFSPSPSPKIRFNIHLNYEIDQSELFNRQVEYYTKFSNKNSKSKIILHPEKSHMLHYTDAPKIIESILEMTKK